MGLHRASIRLRKVVPLPGQILVAAALMLCAALSSVLAVSAGQQTKTPDEARGLLEKGNQRFCEFGSDRPNFDKLRLRQLAESGRQEPFAIIVGCADSRVPPELVFHTGLGDLFVVRSAGQVLDRASLDTIDYGVRNLNAPLVVVLGHSKCGAVEAAIGAIQGRSPAPAHIAFLAKNIRPAVVEAKARSGNPLGSEKFLVDAIKENVASGVEGLKKRPTLAEAIKAQRLKIVRAYYDLHSGKVDFF